MYCLNSLRFIVFTDCAIARATAERVGREVRWLSSEKSGRVMTSGNSSRMVNSYAATNVLLTALTLRNVFMKMN